ncbi:1081_t:CDS:1, partial [Acaulospora morrowiae]
YFYRQDERKTKNSELEKKKQIDLLHNGNRRQGQSSSWCRQNRCTFMKRL